MDVSLRFLEELALLLLLAAGTAYVLARFHLPPLLGYLVAGLALGQGGARLITQVDFVRALGDLGVILIMFGLGLDFELERLRRTATLSVLTGVASVLFTFVAVNGAALLLGVTPLAALFLAAALSICGSAVNLKILSDLGHLKREYGAGIATTIVVTDIVAILLLTSLSGVAIGGGLEAGAIWLSLVKAAAFLVLAPAVGFWLVPRVLNAVAIGTRSREAILVTVLALCFGGALLSQGLGFSLALGSFVVGLTASEARVIHRIEEMTKPLEHIFGTLFFFSVGLTADARQALPLWPVVLLLVFLIVVTKLVSVSSIMFLRGRNGIAALAGAWALVPIGEFSFVIVNEAVRLGVLPASTIAVAVVVCLLTSALAVVGLRNTNRTVTAMVERLPASALNLMTLLQLRASSGASVPGLSEVTAGLSPENDGTLARPRDPERVRLWRETQEIVIHAVLVITLVLGLSGLAGFLAERFPHLLGFPLALAGLAVVLCAPSAVIIFRTGADVARLVSEALAHRFPDMDARMLRGTLLAACTFLLVVLLEAAFFPLVVVRLKDYGTEALVLAAGLTIVVGFVFWRSVVRLQRGLAGLVRHSFAVAAGREPVVPQAAPVTASADIRTDSERTMIVSLPVPADSWIVGKALEEVRLENETGVTILGVERDETWLGRPVDAVVVKSADEIVVIGSDEERMKAGLLVGTRGSRG